MEDYEVATLRSREINEVRLAQLDGLEVTVPFGGIDSISFGGGCVTFWDVVWKFETGCVFDSVEVLPFENLHASFSYQFEIPMYDETTVDEVLGVVSIACRVLAAKLETLGFGEMVKATSESESRITISRT